MSLDIGPLDGTTLWQDGQTDKGISESGILSLKQQLYTVPDCYVDFRRLQNRTLEDIATLYEACTKDAPAQGPERGLMKFDLTPFCRELAAEQYRVTRNVRGALTFLFPSFSRLIGATSLEGLSRENLAQEVKELFRQRFNKKPEVSITAKKIFLICPYKKFSLNYGQLPADIWTLIDFYLSLRDRIQLHSTCKRLRTPVMLASILAIQSDGISHILSNAILRNVPMLTFLTQQRLVSDIKNKVTEISLASSILPALKQRHILHFFTNLQSLTLRNEDVDSSHLDVLAGCVQLTTLQLEEFALEQEQERAFANMCQRLTTLQNFSFKNSYLCNTYPRRQLAAKSPTVLSHLPTSVKRLSFTNCKITNTDLHKLERLTSLQTLIICTYQAGQINNGVALHRLPVTLTHLRLQLTYDLEDDDLIDLQRLTALTKLCLRNCYSIRGTHFSSLPLSLTSLDCRGCKMTQVNLNSLQRLVQLQTFRMSFVQDSWPLTFPETLQPLSQSVRKLSLLWNHGALGISWIDFRVRVQSLDLETLSNLTSLDLSIDEHFLELMSRSDLSRYFSTLQTLTKLEKLQFSCLTQMIKPHLFEQLPPSLQSLDLHIHLYERETLPSSIINTVAQFQSQRPHCLVTYYQIRHITSWSQD